MLSVAQQKMILMLWIKQNQNADEFLQRDSLKIFYKGDASFYKSVAYLNQAGIIQKLRLEKGEVGYRLTMPGALLGKIFCDLPDVPKEFALNKTFIDVLLNWRS